MKNLIYTFVSPQIQNFSIPSNIIYYMNHSTVSPFTLEKLQQTCKYFFAKHKCLVINNQCFTNLNLKESNIGGTLKNLAKINTMLMFSGKLHLYFLKKCNSNVMKAICSKIYYNSITSLSLYCTTLKISDYEIVTSSKFLKDVQVQDCNILDNNENEISLDKIFKQTPNVEKFNFYTYGVSDGLTNKIMENMTAILKGNYLKYFSVAGCLFSSNFDPNLLCTFIKKAAAPNAEFRFFTCKGFNEQYLQIKKAMNEMIEEWDISDHPKLVIEVFL